MELTETDFWDDYWKNQGSTCGINRGFSFERCLSIALQRVLKDRKGESILEVGCAPGRWMSFFGGELGLVPSGIEYSPVGVAITEKYLEAMNVRYGNLFVGDFFEIVPQPKYDVVISFGFIEHFDNVVDVVKRALCVAEARRHTGAGRSKLCGRIQAHPAPYGQWNPEEAQRGNNEQGIFHQASGRNWNETRTIDIHRFL